MLPLLVIPGPIFDRSLVAPVSGQDCCQTGAGHTNYFASNQVGLAPGGEEISKQAWILLHEPSSDSNHSELVRFRRTLSTVFFRLTFDPFGLILG